MATLAEIFEMLRVCAPDCVVVQKEHHYWVRYRGRTYKALPLGRHGASRENLRAEIENFHVRKLVRFLRIDKACAATQIASLRA